MIVKGLIANKVSKFKIERNSMNEPYTIFEYPINKDEKLYAVAKDVELYDPVRKLIGCKTGVFVFKMLPIDRDNYEVDWTTPTYVQFQEDEDNGTKEEFLRFVVFEYFFDSFLDIELE